MDYSILQQKIDKLIYIMGGSEKLADFLDSMLKEKEREIQISSFITLSVCQRFEMQTEDLKGTTREASDARNICYKMHKEFLSMSVRSICKKYNKPIPSVQNGLNRMDEIIQDPKVDMIMYNHFIHVKNVVEKFINFTNQNSNGK